MAPAAVHRPVAPILLALFRPYRNPQTSPALQSSENGYVLSLQRAGGIAALVEASAYIVGFAVLATLLNPGIVEGWSSGEKLVFAIQNKLLIQVWMTFIYVVFGVLLVVLTVALHERLSKGAVGTMQVASAFGLIWAGLVIAGGMVAVVGLDLAAELHVKDAAQAASLWASVGAIQSGLGGGVEIVGGLWMGLLSIAALRSGRLPAPLIYTGLAVSAAGVLTAVPGLSDIGAVFGIGQIVWFLWIGVTLLRRL
jgi:hypothetical protein